MQVTSSSQTDRLPGTVARSSASVPGPRLTGAHRQPLTAEGEEPVHVSGSSLAAPPGGSFPLDVDAADRPDTLPRLESTLGPGVTVAFVPAQAGVRTGDWRGACGEAPAAAPGVRGVRPGRG